MWVLNFFPLPHKAFRIEVQKYQFVVVFLTILSDIVFKNFFCIISSSVYSFLPSEFYFK